MSPLPHAWRLIDKSIIAPPRVRQRPLFKCSIWRLILYAALTAYFFFFLYLLFFPATHRLFGT